MLLCNRLQRAIIIADDVHTRGGAIFAEEQAPVRKLVIGDELFQSFHPLGSSFHFDGPERAPTFAGRGAEAHASARQSLLDDGQSGFAIDGHMVWCGWWLCYHVVRSGATCVLYRGS
jgi:hypothetical protein